MQWRHSSALQSGVKDRKCFLASARSPAYTAVCTNVCGTPSENLVFHCLRADGAELVFRVWSCACVCVRAEQYSLHKGLARTRSVTESRDQIVNVSSLQYCVTRVLSEQIQVITLIALDRNWLQFMWRCSRWPPSSQLCNFLLSGGCCYKFAANVSKSWFCYVLVILWRLYYRDMWIHHNLQNETTSVVQLLWSDKITRRQIFYPQIVVLFCFVVCLFFGGDSIVPSVSPVPPVERETAEWESLII